MKVFFISIALLTMVGFAVSDTKLTDEERAMAVEEMTSSLNHLLSTVEGLSEAQLNFKSSPESWSIAECVEHITISEVTFSDMLKGILQTPADPANREKVKVSDKDLIAMMKDRSNKVKTQTPFEPTGKFGSHDATLAEFEAKRARNVKYVKETEDDLRNRVQDFPFGTVDAYQVILFMAAHSERHILQMEEVMADPKFPK